MPIYELAAIGAAACWALSGAISADPVARLGPFAFTRIRMAMVLVMLAGWVAFSGGWETIGADQLWPIALSGVIGVFVGDTMLFMTMHRLGPRRTSILFAMNAPISVVLGWIFLGERLSLSQAAGG